MHDMGSFYRESDRVSGTHLALRWNRRTRFTVPRNRVAREECWRTFLPGRLELPLRVMARLPHLSRAQNCIEGERLASIRSELEKDAGLSCCRTGTPGVWSKDTILFLRKDAVEPAYVVKAGTGDAIGALLRNEADWLCALGSDASLKDHIPEYVAHHLESDLSFVAERPLRGELRFEFGEPHRVFLQKLQDRSRRRMPFEDSNLYRNLCLRMDELRGLLTEAWSTRLEAGIRRIEQLLTGTPVLVVDAHNDFTPWNIRVENGVARVFDWEYADHEQLPLFDVFHFALMPLALKGESKAGIIKKMQATLRLCPQWLRPESCYKGEAQVLAYLINLCTLYLLSDLEASKTHPALASYAATIEALCK